MGVLEKARAAYQTVKAMRNGCQENHVPREEGCDKSDKSTAEQESPRTPDCDISDLCDKSPGGSYVAPGYDPTGNPFDDEMAI